MRTKFIGGRYDNQEHEIPDKNRGAALLLLANHAAGSNICLGYYEYKLSDQTNTIPIYEFSREVTYQSPQEGSHGAGLIHLDD